MRARVSCMPLIPQDSIRKGSLFRSQKKGPASRYYTLTMDICNVKAVRLANLAVPSTNGGEPMLARTTWDGRQHVEIDDT